MEGEGNKGARGGNRRRTCAAGHVLAAIVLLQARDEIGLVAREVQRALAEQLFEVGDLEGVVVSHYGWVVVQ